MLACRNLSLGYGAGVLVRGLSFTLQDGGYLCVVGENGSGKSTLVRTLLGLQAPLGGRVDLGVRPDEVGYLPQQAEVRRDFPASAWEIVLSGCQGRCGLRPFYNREEKRLAAEAMARMGIAPLAARCYRELSGGQRQRVLFARALCAARRMLVLDEPASGLDPQAGAEMYGAVGELNRRGVTVVMVSHDVPAALAHGDHILRLGKRPFFGTGREYREEAGI